MERRKGKAWEGGEGRGGTGGRGENKTLRSLFPHLMRTSKNNILVPFEPQLPGPQWRGPDIKRRTLLGSQNVTLRNGNMERNGSAPKINPGDFEKQQWLCPGDLEKQLFGALRTLIAWAPRAGAGRKGWGPYRAPLPGPRHLPDLVVHLLLVVAVVVIIMGCPVESPRQQSQVV